MIPLHEEAANATAPWSLADLVRELRAARTATPRSQKPPRAHSVPSREMLANVLLELRAGLFPEHFGPRDLTPQALDYFVGHGIDRALRGLLLQVQRGMQFACEHPEVGCSVCAARGLDSMQEFSQRLATIGRLLASDVRAAYDGDPAATSVDETITCYPGVAAITYHRIAHELYRLRVPLVPRIIAELSHAQTGIDIHPGAQIGGSFFIDHGTGVVIGETCRIGERVRIYQGVTLGAKSMPLDGSGRPIKGQPRHPIVEDDVIIYAGATVLGTITIGSGSILGGNVWLTRSVPPQSRITQAQVRSDVFEEGSGI